MRRLSLPEYTTRAFAALDRATREALQATGAVQAYPDAVGHTVLTSTSLVGVVRYDETELRITPKVSIGRLLWLLAHAHDPRGWREHDPVQLDTAPTVTGTVAVALLAAARTITTDGPLRGYRATNATLPVLKGRWRTGDQLRRHGGLVTPLDVRYDCYTANIPENQIVRTALDHLLVAPGLPAGTRTRLHQLAATLAEASPLPSTEPIPDVHWHALNERYRPLVILADLVLTGNSLHHQAGSVTATGFLFDLNRVFEDWLTTRLGHVLGADGPYLQAQPRTHLDTHTRLTIQPDLVFEHPHRPRAVLDAKYKRATATGQPHTDLYQLLAYCTALNAGTGHLIYAAGDHPRTHLIRNTRTTLHTWPLDLTQPPHHLDHQLTTLTHTLTQPPADTV